MITHYEFHAHLLLDIHAMLIQTAQEQFLSESKSHENLHHSM